MRNVGPGDVNVAKLQTLIPTALPEHVLGTDGAVDKARLEQWVHMILHAHRKVVVK